MFKSFFYSVLGVFVGFGMLIPSIYAGSHPTTQKSSNAIFFKKSPDLEKGTPNHLEREDENQAWKKTPGYKLRGNAMTRPAERKSEKGVFFKKSPDLEKGVPNHLDRDNENQAWKKTPGYKLSGNVAARPAERKSEKGVFFKKSPDLEKGVPNHLDQDDAEQAWQKASGYKLTGTNSNGSGRQYVVKKGDTLSGISKHFYGKAGQFPKIASANRLKNANVISIGQKLQIP